MTFTPQCIRNLMNYRFGGASTEEQIKILIGRVLLEDGNSCLIIEDEWGLTCGVVVQSNAQKNLFKHWGDNLVLDWTHNTNNMGFYLGSLVVTVATGRGTSKYTLKEVLSFFKKINPTWKSVESLVIDKVFTETAALQEEFPGAMASSFFHAIKYVKQMIHSHKYDVPRNKRDDVGDLFRVMLYAPSQKRCNARKHIFELEVVKMAPVFSNYFAPVEQLWSQTAFPGWEYRNESD
ncbi:hypothetical protein PHMEG_00020018 [Phytophthora megakarya]|uniref:ZSWIM1/3 RNaseH-like domain-containing protein n=1 Tax=Phytophthora megakarya TaxID=4795 RepID=A0A225VPV1_9STRA|nr:hypothetical protein PHMEG_00020018 [Phytophthora megakarya]